MSLVAIRQGLANNLSTIQNLRTSWYVPDNPTPPIAIIVPNRVEYDLAMARGGDTYTFSVLVIAQRMSERTAQTTLDAFCDPTGPSSVKTAIELDRTLGGAAMTLRVTDLSEYGPLAVGETQYLAATFTVAVVAAT